jgi:hypothetical protein
MDAGGSTVTGAARTAPLPSAAPRRADAGSIRLSQRDVAGLMLCGDMYGAPYDLLAAFLDTQPARLRGIVARWRNAGYAATGRLGPGPAWCWLTRSGLADTGQHYTPSRPALGRLAHICAGLAVRLSLRDSAAPAGIPAITARSPLFRICHEPLFHAFGSEITQRPPRTEG